MGSAFLYRGIQGQVQLRLSLALGGPQLWQRLSPQPQLRFQVQDRSVTMSFTHQSMQGNGNKYVMDSLSLCTQHDSHNITGATQRSRYRVLVLCGRLRASKKVYSTPYYRLRKNNFIMPCSQYKRKNNSTVHICLMLEKQLSWRNVQKIQRPVRKIISWNVSLHTSRGYLVYAYRLFLHARHFSMELSIKRNQLVIKITGAICNVMFNVFNFLYRAPSK